MAIKSESEEIMKKKLLMTMMMLGICAACAGCSQDTSDTDTDTAQTEEVSTEAETEENTEMEEEGTGESAEVTTADLMKDIDVEKCVTLGQYKGITVEKTIQAVTDEDVENEIQSALASYPVEQEGREAQEGDTVNIDYVGRIDGEEFEGGSDTGADLLLGSGQFIEGFEDGLIGATAGETRVLDLTFPSDYTEELSGKDVEFTVTVNAVKVPLEEPTDEWVAANIEGYSTVEEYRAGIRSQQEENNQQTADDQVQYTAWMQVVDSSTINEYPQTLVDMGKDLYRQQAELYAQFSGQELEEFIESSGVTMEEYEENAEEYGKGVAAQALVAQAICDAEGYQIGDETYQASLEQMMSDYGLTEDELYESYGRDNVEQTIQLQRVYDLIMANATVTETQAEAETAEE